MRDYDASIIDDILGSTSSAMGSFSVPSKCLRNRGVSSRVIFRKLTYRMKWLKQCSRRSSSCNKKSSKLRQIHLLQMDETKEAIKVKRLRKRVGIAWKSVTKLISSMLKIGRNSSNPQVFLKPFWLC